MSEFPRKNVSCEGCAKCCEDILLPLNREEARFLREGGTVLRTHLPAAEGIDWSKEWKHKKSDDPNEQRLINFVKTLKKGQGIYDILGACGYLNNLRCTIYEDPRRPRVCQDFTPGSFGCTKIRIGAGIETKESVLIEMGIKPPPSSNP